MSGILSVDRTTHQQLKSPKADNKTVDEINPYMALVDSHDIMDLSSQANTPVLPKHGKMKTFFYKALNLFSPTTLPAIQAASQRLSQQHVTKIDAIQQSLAEYLLLRAGYRDGTVDMPKKAPKPLLNAEKQYKAHAKQLKEHIQLLEKAHRLHGLAFVDTKRADLNRVYDQVNTHFATLQEEVEDLFPKKAKAVLNPSILILDASGDQAMRRIQADLVHSKATLNAHVDSDQLPML